MDFETGYKEQDSTQVNAHVNAIYADGAPADRTACMRCQTKQDTRTRGKNTSVQLKSTCLAFCTRVSAQYHGCSLFQFNHQCARNSLQHTACGNTRRACRRRTILTHFNTGCTFQWSSLHIEQSTCIEVSKISNDLFRFLLG